MTTKTTMEEISLWNMIRPNAINHYENVKVETHDQKTLITQIRNVVIKVD